MSSNGLDGLQVNVQTVDPVSPPGTTPRALEGMLMPTTDESGTQISSSSGSAKPPSLDGKSVTSGTTFALDEKESLRPDDSASVKATEDEDALLSSSGMPDSRTGSDNGGQRVFHDAFGDQLREISYMESAQAGQRQVFPHGVNPQGVLYVPPQGSGVGVVPSQDRTTPMPNAAMDFLPDPLLLEALDSPKDRIMVLKLEQDIVDFVKDPKEVTMELPQTNSFYRRLAHKLADYYMLGHAADSASTAVKIFKSPHCRLPPPLTGIATPSTAASTPPPSHQMKILRRGGDKPGPTIVNGSNTASKTASENEESGDDKRTKLPATREEREARYEAARKRIMGSSKPADSPEQVIDQDMSRSSSATGKKATRRKQRSDSDDDFEARSAYSAYYPSQFSSGAPTPPTYGFANAETQSTQFQPNQFTVQGPNASYQPYGVPANSPWPTAGFQGQSGPPNWTTNHQQHYNLPAELQRTLSFQQPIANHGTNIQPGYPTPYGLQFTQQQQQWPQQMYAPNYPTQPAQNFAPAYPNTNNIQAQSQGQETQPYAFGQLPSQTFPGRPASKLEHPIPGSWKGPHFNPKSQAFVPGQSGSAIGSPYPAPAAPLVSGAYGAGFGMPGQMQRQNSIPPHNPAFGSPRGPAHPMTHPLPQPVFPRQPSPNMPLPPKPEATPPRNAEKHTNPAPVNGTNQHASSIAKWGAPASLPAKPPPPAEPTDAANLNSAQRQPIPVPGRPPNGMPSFGSMPPVAGGIASVRRV